MTLTHNDTNGAAVASNPAWLAESVRAIEPDLQHRFEGYLRAIGDVRAASTLDSGGDFMTKWVPASRVRGLESAFMSCSCASTAIDTVLAQDEASDRTEPGCATHPDRMRGGR